MKFKPRLSIGFALALLLSVALGVGASLYAFRSYLQAQQAQTNTMFAKALATQLTLSRKDVESLRILTAFFYDENELSEVQVLDANGTVLVSFKRPILGVWSEDFLASALLQAEPGGAEFSENRGKVGWVKVRAPVYQAGLSLATLSGFQVLALIVGFIPLLITSLLAMRRITVPLRLVSEQAEAIAQRRFVTLEDPVVPELRPLFTTMNHMSVRLRAWFEQESERLTRMQLQANFDPVSKLANREFFLSQFRDYLKSGPAVSGYLVVIEILNLAELNETMGYHDTNRLLMDFGTVLKNFMRASPEAMVGRLRGAEFGMVVPGVSESRNPALRLTEEALEPFREHWRNQIEIRLIAVSVPYEASSHPGEVLAQVDQSIARCKHSGVRYLDAAPPSTVSVRSNEEWRRLIMAALERDHLVLEYYDVVSAIGFLVHREAMVSIKGPSQITPIKAVEFLPFAYRFDLLTELDLKVCKAVIDQLATKAFDVAVNLSAESFADPQFHESMRALLARSRVNARISFEVPVRAIDHNLKALERFSNMARSLGCRFGFEGVGQTTLDMNALKGVELDYVKLHPTLSSDILESDQKRLILEETCALLAAEGILSIATGVETLTDMTVLKQLGVGAMTGRMIRHEP